MTLIQKEYERPTLPEPQPIEMVGGFEASTGSLQSGAMTLDAVNQKIELGSGDNIISIDALDTTYRIAIGNKNYASAPFRVTKAGVLTATGATITGTITATLGAIGGFNIGSDYIRDVANSFGLASTVTGGDDVRFWAGDTYANRATAPFRVTEAGAVTASSFTHSGGSVGSSVVVATGALNKGVMAWTTDIVFSVTDADTIAWTSGSVRMQDGTTYSISSGNTGNMSALTYVYIDIAVSTTVFQTTTTYTTATGDGKILIAACQNHTISASVIPYGGQQPLIDGSSQIAALSIVAGNIAASTITAGKLTISTLSAITADMGSITAGTIVLSASGHIRSGQTDFSAGTGFFLGISGGVAKFSIGDGGTSQYMEWDGTNLVVNGRSFSSEPAFGDGSDGDVTITGGTTTLTRDMFYDDLTVSSTGILETAGFRVFVKGTLTVSASGLIQRNGTTGTAGSGGTGGTGASALAAGSIPGGSAGGRGGDQNNDNDAVGGEVAKSIGSVGGTGGKGGNSGGSTLIGYDGSAGGSQSGTAYNVPRSFLAAYLLCDTQPSVASLGGSTGGGGGGGGRRQVGSTTLSAGGGGGSAGGIVFISARYISNAGTIRALGGAGGAGQAGGSDGDVGGGGGGGGGAGGVIILVYQTLTGAGSVSVAGGAGGAGGSDSVAPGAAGSSGSAGVTYSLVLV